MDRPTGSRIRARTYLIMGGLCLLASVPFWILLASGRLLEERDPWRLLPALGTLPGLLLLGYGTGRLPASSLSDTALRVSGIGLAFLVLLLGSWVGVTMGAQALATSVRFCAMAASYFAFMSFILLVAATARGRRDASGPLDRERDPF